MIKLVYYLFALLKIIWGDMVDLKFKEMVMLKLEVAQV